MMEKPLIQSVSAKSFSRPRTIFTTSIPREIQILLAAAPNLDKSTFRKLIKGMLVFFSLIVDRYLVVGWKIKWFSQL